MFEIDHIKPPLCAKCRKPVDSMTAVPVPREDGGTRPREVRWTFSCHGATESHIREFLSHRPFMAPAVALCFIEPK